MNKTQIQLYLMIFSIKYVVNTIIENSEIEVFECCKCLDSFYLKTFKMYPDVSFEMHVFIRIVSSNFNYLDA